MTIIGLGHVARSGKDVAASALARDLGFRRVAFADKLKELALHLDPIVTASTHATNVGAGKGRLAWVVQGMGWDEAKAVYPEVRALLQRLGLGARETFGEDFWVDRCLPATAAGRKADIVVSDVRFLNEAEAIQRAGGKLIRIDRPGHAATGHVSETQLADFEGWDAIIPNNGSIRELELAVVTQVKEWM